MRMRARGVVAKVRCGIRQTQRGRRRVCDDREREPTAGGDALSLPRNCCWKAKKKLLTSPRFQPRVLPPTHPPRLCVRCRWVTSRVAESSDQLPSHVPVHNHPPSPLPRTHVRSICLCSAHMRAPSLSHLPISHTLSLMDLCRHCARKNIRGLRLRMSWSKCARKR